MARYKRLKDGTFQKIEDDRWDMNEDGTFTKRTSGTSTKRKTTETKKQLTDPFKAVAPVRVSTQQNQGLTYEEVIRRLTPLNPNSEEYKALKNYMGYTDLKEFDKAIAAEKERQKEKQKRNAEEKAAEFRKITSDIQFPIRKDAGTVNAKALLESAKKPPFPINKASAKNLLESASKTSERDSDEKLSKADEKKKEDNSNRKEEKDGSSYLRELEKARRIYALDHKFDLYADYMKKEDFEEKSKYVPKKSESFWEKLIDENYTDKTYEYINDVNGARAEIKKQASTYGKDSGDTTASQEKKGYDKLTKDEVAVYNYIYATEGKKKAQAFLDDMEITLTKRIHDEETARLKYMIDGSAASSALLSAASVPANLVGNVQGAIESAVDKIEGKEYNPYGYYKTLSNFASDTRGTVSENIEQSTKGAELFGRNIPSFLYQTGMSTADSVAGTIFGKAYAPMMAGGVYQQRARELKEAGATEKQVQLGALSSAADEGIGTYFSLGKLFKIKGTDSILKSIAKQAMFEGSEEAVTELANIASDWAIRGEDSDVYQKYQEYRNGGYSDSEATKKTIMDLAGQTGWAAAGGALSGGVMGAGASALAKTQTGFTKNEKKVIEKETENRITKQEANGKKLSTKEKAEIKKEVEEELEKGRISIDTIESALGGETQKAYEALSKESEEFHTLNRTKSGELTGEQSDRLAELKEKNRKNPYESALQEIKGKLSQEVDEITKNDLRIRESYNERDRRSKAFEADLSQYKNEYQRKTVENAIGKINNTSLSHDFVDFLGKVAKDKSVVIDLTNNQRLKGIAFEIEGKTVNGYVENGTITLNTDSNNWMNTIVGHEVMHVLEETEHFDTLKSAIFAYAKTKGEYDSRLEYTKKLYENVKDADIENELAADLVGEYIFGDEKFVKSLSVEQPNLFKRIYGEIKYLLKCATTGSKEERQLLKAKKVFEEAYRENGKTSGGIKYDISIDADGNSFVDIKEDILDAKDGESVARIIQKVIVNKFSNLIDANGQKIQINKTTNDEFRRSKSANALKKISQQMYNDKLRTIANADEILRESKNWIGESIKHERKDDIVEFGRGNIQYRVNGNGYVADVIVGIRKNGSAVLYDLVNIYEKRIVEASVTMASNKSSQRRQNTSTKSKLPHGKEDVKTQFYQSETPLNERVTGDALLDAEDLISEIEDLAEISPNGYVTLYHRTTEENAKKIMDTGKMSAKEDGIFFSTKKNSIYTDGYGDSVVKFKIPVEKLVLDDIFDDEAHLRIILKNRNQVLDVSDYLANSNIEDQQNTTKNSEKTPFSLSKESDKKSTAPTKGWKVSGKDLAIAPIGENVKRKTNTENIVPEGFPIRKDIAPAQKTKNETQSDAPLSTDNILQSEENGTKKFKRSEYHKTLVDGIKKRFSEEGFDFDEVLNKAKNKSTWSSVDNTPQRFMEKTFGYKEGQILSDLTVNQTALNESEAIRWLNSYTDRKSGILAQICERYHIKPGSKESAAAQMYGEGFYVNEAGDYVKYGDAELAKDFKNPQVQRNIKSLAKDPQIREIYDDTLNAINESRKRNGYPEIPRRNDYFLHFRAMDDTFSRIGIPFNPNDIRAKDLPTDINGMTADLKPGQPYFASAMQRKGKRTTYDLIGGLERYLTSAKNQIYHIDDIQTLRALRNYIADTYGQAKGLESLDELSEEEAASRIEQVYGSHLSTFAKFLNEQANTMAGKTALIDRALEGIIGRRGITFLDTVNKQVGSNMVGFNASSALTNVVAAVQAFAKGNKYDAVRAFAQIASDRLGKIKGKSDGFAEEDPFIIRRKGAEKFTQTPYEKVKNTGYVLASAIDDSVTEFIVRMKYNELTRKGMNEYKAHIEADKWAARILGDRSYGQQPLLYNSKMLGLVTKFQLEVRNQLDSMYYDTIQETKASTEEIQDTVQKNTVRAAKITCTFVELAVLQHVFGMAFEAVAGYNPTFDIIDVLIKTFGWDDDEDSEDTMLDNLEQGFAALLDDLPYTSIFTGGRIPIASALPIKQLISGKDEYGNEKSRSETFGEAAPYYILPGGYGQLKKTVKGMSMFNHDVPGSYTNSGKLRFPIKDTVGNRAKAAVFGQYANENAREYFDKGRAPLTEKQMTEWQELDIPISEYWEIKEGMKGMKKLSEKADYIGHLDLPIEKKNILINNVVQRKKPIDMTDYELFENWEEFDRYIKQNTY